MKNLTRSVSRDKRRGKAAFLKESEDYRELEKRAGFIFLENLRIKKNKSNG